MNLPDDTGNAAAGKATRRGVSQQATLFGGVKQSVSTDATFYPAYSQEQTGSDFRRYVNAYLWGGIRKGRPKNVLYVEANAAWSATGEAKEAKKKGQPKRWITQPGLTEEMRLLVTGAGGCEAGVVAHMCLVLQVPCLST